MLLADTDNNDSYYNNIETKDGNVYVCNNDNNECWENTSAIMIALNGDNISLGGKYCIEKEFNCQQNKSSLHLSLFLNSSVIYSFSLIPLFSHSTEHIFNLFTAIPVLSFLIKIHVNIKYSLHV